MSGGKLSIFIPINKIDEEQRLVYGQVAAEVLDNAGEVFDYAGSKPYFEKWSENAFSTSGGKSHGNVRVMHTAKVAGIVASPLGFNDNDCTIEAVAKVVDDAEWEMVKAGGYTGFSMGGRYVERIKKGDEKRYIADPVEISLVDKPCIPTATFEVIKADGIVEEHRFREDLYITEIEELEKAAKKDAEYGDVEYADTGFQSDGKKRYPIDTAKHIRAAWSYINQEKNAGEYSAKDLKTIKSRITAAWKKTIDKDGPPSAAKKSDGGNMYEPTNDEMLPVAKSLAKAAGKTEADWLEFMDAARADVIAKHDGGQEISEEPAEQVEAPAQADEPAAKADDAHDSDKCDVADCAKCAAMKADKPDDKEADGNGGDEEDKSGEDEDEEAAKADTVEAPELRQAWLAKDDTPFARKADAAAHNDKLNGKAAAPTLSERVAALAKTAAAIAAGEVELGQQPETPGLRKTTTDAVELPLAKFDAFMADPLVKGMYQVSRLADIVESLGYIHSSLASEAAWEGDNSTIPGEVLDSLTSLGGALVRLAEEEVKELIAASAKNAGIDVLEIEVLELAAGTLGLEKAALGEDLQKRMPAPAQPAADTDTLAKLDAAEKRAEDAVAKADAATEELSKLTPMIDELQKSMAAILALPKDKAPTTRVVSKGDDGKVAGDTPSLLGKSEQELSEMAIKLAQSRPMHIGFGGRPGQ